MSRLRFAQRPRPRDVALFIYTPVIVVLWFGWVAVGAVGRGDFAIFRRAGSALLQGQSPLVEPTVKLLSANDRFVYPTPAALPFVPFAVMPAEVAMALFFLVSVGAVVAALWLFGVRDWRCYGAALLSMPVLSSLLLGTIGPFLLLLIAVGWRLRHRSVAGVPLALAAGAKLFLWPLLLWLLITRRFRAFVASVVTISAVLLLWAVVDAEGLRRYPQTIRVLNDVQRWKSFSVQSLLVSLHASGRSSEIASAVLILAAIASMVVLRRRDDSSTFALVVVVALIATPIFWMHYLVLLLAPIAVTRHRFTPLWLLPIALVAVPHPSSLGAVWRIVFVLALLGVAAARTVGNAGVEDSAADSLAAPKAAGQAA